MTFDRKSQHYGFQNLHYFSTLIFTSSATLLPIYHLHQLRYSGSIISDVIIIITDVEIDGERGYTAQSATVLSQKHV